MSVNITEIVKRVQRKVGAEVDGIDGPETWTKIAKAFGIESTPQSTFSGVAASPIGDELASIAESQIGTQEDSAHTNRGNAILKYQRSTWLQGQGWPWCAAFVDWCVSQLFSKHPELGRVLPSRPQTASAFGLIEWGKEAGCAIITADPARGDIVIYQFSHCGVVVDADLAHGTFHAVEGNTNDVGGRDGYIVARRARNVGSVKKFIRLPATNTRGKM